MNLKRLWVRLAVVLSLLTVMEGGASPETVVADAATNMAAQTQVEQILTPLRDSEAERASGAYVPGVGAVFSLDLVRGPNTASDKPAATGVRDWVIYLMQTFGSKLDAVPGNETIAMNVEYYDYSTDSYHQFTAAARAATISDPATYSFWVDGSLAAGSPALISGATATPLSSPSPTVSSSTATIVPTPTEATPLATPFPAGPVHLTATFADASDVSDWIPVAGAWGANGGAYEQTELGRFDLVSYYDRPVAGDFTLSADVHFIAGVMGAGLVFDAPRSSTKNGANMMSFAGNGNYVQWGAYDSFGVFQYVGGVSLLRSVADAAWHHIDVRVSGSTFSVSLDGIELGSAIPITDRTDGYAGLLASTSHVQFDNVVIESVAP